MVAAQCSDKRQHNAWGYIANRPVIKWVATCTPSQPIPLVLWQFLLGRRTNACIPETVSNICSAKTAFPIFQPEARLPRPNHCIIKMGPKHESTPAAVSQAVACSRKWYQANPSGYQGEPTDGQIFSVQVDPTNVSIANPDWRQSYACEVF